MKYFFLSLMLIMTGCKKDFEDLLADPTKPSTVNAEFLFTEALRRGMSDDFVGIRTEVWTLMVWNQQMADIRGEASSSDFYNYGAAASNDIWDRWFVGSLTNLQEMIRIVENDPGSINKLATARIWKVYMYHRITDLWGDVPYSEALQANTPGIVLSPAYDRQQDIYTHMLTELEQAAASFNPSLDDLGAADPFYGGDIIAWKRFANSLRLRLAIRISNANPALAQQHGTAVLNGGMLISSELQSARFPHNDNNASSIYQVFNVLVNGTVEAHYYPSDFFVEMLEANDDPRLDVFTDPTPESAVLGVDVYDGIPNLSLASDLGNRTWFNTSPVDERFYQMAMESNTMSYAEVCFLQAEAALLGWGGSAQSRYEEGVRASMMYFGIDQTAIDDYLNGAGAFDGTLEQIITEKWINSQYRDGFEPFAEYRRTGFPQLKDSSGNPVDPIAFPQRLPYPQSEVLFNSNNVQAVGEGINDLFTKVWWAE